MDQKQPSGPLLAEALAPPQGQHFQPQEALAEPQPALCFQQRGIGKTTQPTRMARWSTNGATAWPTSITTCP